MSAALSRLRQLLGDELFIRSPAGLQPTPCALDLAEPLGRALAEIGRTLAFTHSFEPQTSTATFTLGLSEHPTFTVLPRLVERLREDAPGLILRVRSFVARDEAVSLLDAGEVDLAVGVPPTLSAGRILTRLLFEEGFVCIVRRDHPVARAPLDLHTFLSLSHLLVSPENERFGHVDAALARRGLKRRLALTLPQLYAASALVARSDLIATLMESVVDASGRDADLTRLAVPLELEPIPFTLIWHRRNDAHPAQRWLRETIAGLYGRSG